MENATENSNAAVSPAKQSVWTQLFDLNRAYSGKQVTAALAEIDGNNHVNTASHQHFKPLTLWL